MVPSYLLSLLKVQALAMTDRFGERYPYHWLIWEPGTWTAPASAHDTVQADPRNPSVGGVGRGDALSFALKPNPARPGTLTVGRNHTNDIVVNDATVSRQHAVLHHQLNGTWTIEVGKNVRALSKLSEVDLRPGEPVALKSASQLRLGDVRLTYYDSAGMLIRLRGAR
ncbi:MAG TPA: FHA domain-containing protein [Myxococcales bacterium]|nr:FHA domain-containing protein [Myxococcales bacterium]